MTGIQNRKAEKEKEPSPPDHLALLIACGDRHLGFLFRLEPAIDGMHYLDRLSHEPGIVITSSGKRNGGWYVEGLRDPMAIDPDQFGEEQRDRFRKKFMEDGNRIAPSNLPLP